MNPQLLRALVVSLRSRNTTAAGLLCGGALVCHAWFRPLFETVDQGLGVAGLGILLVACLCRDGHATSETVGAVRPTAPQSQDPTP
jgi:hypothetical protein